MNLNLIAHENNRTAVANSSAHSVRVSRVDVDNDAFRLVSPSSLPIDVPPGDSHRLAFVCAPPRTAARGALTAHVTIELRLRRRSRLLRVRLLASVALPPAASAPVASAKRLKGTPPAATAQHAKLFDRAREKQALQLLKQQQQQQHQHHQHQQHQSPQLATPADSLLSLSSKRADESFRRLERRLADIESQISVVLDLLRQLHARPAAAAAPPSAVARRGSLGSFNPLLSDDAIDGGDDDDDDDGGRNNGRVADNALPDDDDDERRSDYSRPFYGSRNGLERDAVTTPPPPSSALSLGGTKSGANSWQRYVNRVGEFSPTLARMAQDFELQQLQTPARRRIDALRLPESPANQRPNRRNDDADNDDLFAADLLDNNGREDGDDDDDDGNDEVSF